MISQLQMSQNRDGLLMASAVSYKPRIAVNELKHTTLTLVFTDLYNGFMLAFSNFFFLKKH